MKKANILVYIVLIAIIAALLYILIFDKNKPDVTPSPPQNSSALPEDANPDKPETTQPTPTATTTIEQTITQTYITTELPDISTSPVTSAVTEPPAITACAHTFGSWTVTQNPTCTVAGSKIRKCTKCGKEESDVLAALGHNYNFEIVKQSNCTDKGEKRYTCSRCGNYYTEEIAPLGHNYSTNTVDPTCTQDGYTTYKCYRCNYSYQGDVKSALGHSYVNGVCTRCNEIQEIDMLQRISAPDGNESCFYIRQYKSISTRWGVCWKAKNLSGKTIKYVTFTLEYYNKVDDLIYKTKYKITGPIAPGEMIISDSWDTGALNFNLAYHGIDHLSDLGRVAITEVQLQYSDNSFEKGSYSFSTSEIIKK